MRNVYLLEVIEARGEDPNDEILGRQLRWYNREKHTCRALHSTQQPKQVLTRVRIPPQWCTVMLKERHARPSRL